MQFIPEREHMKAGKYIGLASPWDLKKCVCVCMYVLQTLTYFLFKLPTFCSHCTPLLACLFDFKFVCPKRSEVLLKWQQ